MIIFAIKDNKSNTFDQPFLRSTYSEAERNFEMLAQDEKTMIAHYPQDFSLYELGSYDKTDGSILPLDNPKKVLDLPPKSAAQKDA